MSEPNHMDAHVNDVTDFDRYQDDGNASATDVFEACRCCGLEAPVDVLANDGCPECDDPANGGDDLADDAIPWQMKWRDAPWLVLDTETTGLSDADAVVEVAAVTMEHGQVIGRRAALVNPGIPIPEGASAVHGITDADVADAETLSQIAPRIATAIRSIRACGGLVVAYNAPFDIRFLSRDPQIAAALDGAPVLDPLVVVRIVGRFWPGKGRHKLERVCGRLGITLEGAHRASADAVAAGLALWALRESIPALGVQAVSEWCAERRAEQDAAFEAWKASQPPMDAA